MERDRLETESDGERQRAMEKLRKLGFLSTFVFLEQQLPKRKKQGHGSSGPFLTNRPKCSVNR